jgi:hypothetical protein
VVTLAGILKMRLSFSRNDLPKNTNGTIVYNLVTDLTAHSHIKDSGPFSIGFSEKVSTTLKELKTLSLFSC